MQSWSWFWMSSLESLVSKENTFFHWYIHITIGSPELPPTDSFENIEKEVKYIQIQG